MTRQTSEREVPSAGTAPAAGGSMAGFAWTSLGYGSQIVGQVVVVAVLARLLTPADFGLVSLTVALVGFGRMLTQSVIGATIVQRRSLDPDHVRASFWLSLLSGVTLAGALSLLAPVLGGAFDMPRLTSLVRVLAVVFLLQSTTVVAVALLERALAFRRIALVETASFLVGYVLVGVALGFAGAGIWALVGAHTAQAIIFSAAMLRMSRHPTGLSFSRRSLGEVAHLSGGYAAGRVFSYGALQGDNLVVGGLLDAAALGIYGRAYQLVSMPAMAFGQVLHRVLFPTMAAVQEDQERLRRAYRRSVALIVFLMAPVSVFLCIGAPEIVEVLLGDQWSATVAPLRILSVGLIARGAYKVSDTMSVSLGLAYARAARQGVYAALVLGGAALGTRWGVEGVAVAVTTAIVLNHLLMANLCLRHLETGWVGLVKAHWLAAFPSVVGTPVALAVAAVLRGGQSHPALVLVGIAAGMALAFAGLTAVRPRLVLTEDLLWVGRQMRRRGGD